MLHGCSVRDQDSSWHIEAPNTTEKFLVAVLPRICLDCTVRYSSCPYFSDYLSLSPLSHGMASIPSTALLANEDQDIVISTFFHIVFLKMKLSFFQRYHLIIVQDSEPTKTLESQKSLLGNDVECLLGKEDPAFHSRILYSGATACFFVSRNKHIYTIDDECGKWEHYQGHFGRFLCMGK